MNCPKCGTETTEGQNYCGGCGAQLKNACSGCGTINPPFFRYCGQCGRNLVDVGSLLLDRAGLILAGDKKAARILGRKAETLKGKPFSLFVRQDDLVVFYSHWNELMRSSKRQSVEIELAAAAAARHAQIEMGLLRGRTGPASRVHLALSDVTELRRTMQDAQTLQDLVNLIFSWVEAFDPHAGSGREKTVASVLETIGLFAGAQYAFISRIDSRDGTLVTDFTWRAPAGGDPSAGPPPMPIALMARLFDRIKRERQWVVNDTQALAVLERKALREWLRTDVGAILCHLVRRRKTPIAVIGVAAQGLRHWSEQSTALVKLAGRLMADTLPYARPGAALLHPRPIPERREGGADAPTAEPPVETIDIADIEIIEEPPEPPSGEGASQGPGRGNPSGPKPRMKFGSDKTPGDQEREPVFAGEDGKFVMTCPRCGFQDTVSAKLFEVMGSAVRVQCPCGRRFRIIRELRRSFRKKVRLEGYFAQALESGNKLSPGEVWGPMVVQDLSRSGLKFTCGNAGRLRPGDRLQVRFNLDNANQSLVKKTVTVKSVQDDAAGCQFQGTDAYDAVIGFYFL
jgi:hypothetical protein